MIPTVVPTTAFSATSLVGRHRHRSATADVEFIDIVDGDGERLAGERTVAAGRPDGDRCESRHPLRDRSPRRWSPRRCWQSIANSPPALSGQAVGDRIVGGIRIEASAVMPTAVPIGRVFVHFVLRRRHRCGIADIELIDIVDVDREDLVGERCRRPMVARTVMLRRRSVGFAVDRTGDRHDAGR